MKATTTARTDSIMLYSVDPKTIMLPYEDGDAYGYIHFNIIGGDFPIITTCYVNDTDPIRIDDNDFLIAVLDRFFSDDDGGFLGDDDADVDGDELAKERGMSPYHFGRLFEAYMNWMGV